MTKINEVIPAMPQAPDSATDTKTEFNVKADAFVKAWTPHTASINTWATEANAVATEINSVIASLPAGTIDDVNLSTTSAFSNQHVHDTYATIHQHPITPELQAHLDDGNPMPNWDGAVYTQGGVGAGFMIYPNGTITYSASTSTASKYNTYLPDGTAYITGSFVYTSSTLGTTGQDFHLGGFNLVGSYSGSASLGLLYTSGSSILETATLIPAGDITVKIKALQITGTDAPAPLATNTGSARMSIMVIGRWK